MPPRRQKPTRLCRPWDSPGKNIGVGCHFLLQCMKVKSESEVAQSCLTLCDPMDCSLQGSSIHGIFQARVLEWVAIAFPISLTRLKPLTMWITTNCGKFFKRWKYQTTFTCLLRNLCAGQEAIVRTRHGTADLFRIGKAIHQGCHPAYLTYMKSTSCEIPGWMKTRWN